MVVGRATPAGKPQGQPTRGKTAPKRLRRVDNFLALYDAQLEIERLKANMGESKRYDLMKKEIERGEAAVARLESRVRYLTNASTLELAMGVDIGVLKLSKYRGTINVQDP